MVVIKPVCYSDTYRPKPLFTDDIGLSLKSELTSPDFSKMKI